MKAETKAKIRVKARQAWEAIRPWLIPIGVTTTICAAWEGYSNSRRNEREINNVKEYAVRIDSGAYTLYEGLEKRIDALENKNERLLEEAMDVTEGKEPAA